MTFIPIALGKVSLLYQLISSSIAGEEQTVELSGMYLVF